VGNNRRKHRPRRAASQQTSTYNWIHAG